MNPLTLRTVLIRCGILAAMLFVCVLIALKLGAVPVSLYGLGRDLIRVAMGYTSDLSTDYRLIVFDIRLPRILLAIFVGASLSVAGTSFQALLRNPLADPYVLGVSSGSAVGAILALIAGQHLDLPPLLAGLITPLGAFLGGMATIAAVYLLGRREGRIESNTLLLAGIICVSFLSGIITFLLNSLSLRDRGGISFWLLGELGTPLPASLRWILIVGFFAAAGAIYTAASDLNLLLSGEQEAMHLGVDIHRVRLLVYICASILTGLAVSVSGTIGFVGLLVPHIMRAIFGPDHRVLIPTAALGGAIVLVVADMIARTAVAPTEIPVGAVTAVVGAPLFIYVLRRRAA